MDQVTKCDEWTQLFWGQGKFRADFLGVDEVELIGLNDQDCPARWRGVGRICSHGAMKSHGGAQRTVSKWIFTMSTLNVYILSYS